MSKFTAKIFEGIPSNLIYPKVLCKYNICREKDIMIVRFILAILNISYS